jgi:hypothetical protein
MRHDEADAVKKIGLSAGPDGAPLVKASLAAPHSVRVVHMGHEVLGAFILNELDGGIEEIEALSLNEEGRKTGAERTVIDYVVSAARFAHKSAVEVLAPPGTEESRHLEGLGFAVKGSGGALKRYRLALKK